MEIKICKISGNDKERIGLFGRWILTDENRVIVITLTKVDGKFVGQQWGMDKRDNDIESLRLKLEPIKKKYYALKEVDKLIQKYIPNWKK